MGLDGVPDPQKGEIWERNPTQNTQWQTAAKPSVLCCHLANTNEDLGGLAAAIPRLAKLLRSLLLLLLLSFITFVGVVDVPDLPAVVVFEQVDDGSRVARSHVHIIAQYFVVVVVVAVAVLGLAVTAAVVAASARVTDRQTDGHERQTEGSTERA